MGVCGSCGGVNPDEDRFCSDCGAPAGAVCPSCSAVVGPGKRFCGQCGTAVAAVGGPTEVGAPAASAPVAERRVCSVLFCDLVGFTPLSEERDAEEVRELLSRYFETARTVIARYGGVVEKFIGDAVMAVWGTPVALEGDTERAVRAALELVDAIAGLGAELAVPSLAARAGIVTGEVAVTLNARNEGMVAGDAVNTAARVQAAAEPGAVLVDETTRRLAQAGVAFDDSGEHTLKGKTEPQRLWRAGRVLSVVGGAQRVDGLEAPLTGRDVELRLVKDLYHASADRRQPRLVLVSGPAGVGKSRLGWEFEKYVDGLREVTTWHRGRCLSYGDGVAFWALAEIVRQRLGIAEEDAVDTAAAKLLTGVESHVSDTAERLYVGVRLARLLGLPFPGDTGAEIERGELFAGWRLWFERLAATNPVTLLVEDLQYADAGLLDFLDHLVDWARDVPLFVLAFSRPELDEARPGWGRGRNRTFLSLDPLDGASMDELIEALVPGIPPAAVAAIAEQAQGIPLFAVETIRSLIDRDVVVPREGVYRLAGEVGALTVPDSLHGLLAARLDVLDPVSRRLVAEASVLGSSFPLEALVAVSGQAEADVRAAVGDLVRREVLEISADKLSPQRGTYRFAHEMLRQVAYDTLSRRDRKAGHLAVAAHLKSAFPGDGEEVVDVLARHYLDALHAVPTDPDADEVRDQAVAALTRAGDRANRTGSPRRAVESYASAADLLGEGREDADARVADLLERAAEAALDGMLVLRAVELADQAATVYARAGQARSAARSTTIAGRALRLSGRHTEARERLTAAVEALSDNPDADTVRALQQLAGLEVFSGTAAAEQITEEAVVLAQSLAVEPDDLSGVFGIRAVWLAQNGRRPEAVAFQREAARLAEKAGDSGRHGIALMNLSDILAPGDPTAAAETARVAAEHLRRTGLRGYLIYALLNLVTSSLEAGDWATAETVLSVTVQEDGLGDHDEIACYRALFAGLRGDVGTAESLLAGLGELLQNEAPQEQAFVLFAKAFTAVAAGRTRDAFDLARQVVAMADALGIGAEQPRWSWPLAVRSAYELGDAAAVRELLQLLDAFQPGHIVPMLVAGRALGRACLADLEGDEAAGPLFAAAVASLREQGSPYHLAQGLLDQAGHLLRTGQDPRAAVEEGAAIATRLGAAPVLARAESMLQSLRSELSV